MWVFQNKQKHCNYDFLIKQFVYLLHESNSITSPIMTTSFYLMTFGIPFIPIMLNCQGHCGKHIPSLYLVERIQLHDACKRFPKRVENCIDFLRFNRKCSLYFGIDFETVELRYTGILVWYFILVRILKSTKSILILLIFSSLFKIFQSISLKAFDLGD